MTNHNVTIPQLGMIASTRAMVGAGIALILADHIPADQRRAVGWTLALVGGLLTIPLAVDFLSSHPDPSGLRPRELSSRVVEQ